MRPLQGRVNLQRKFKANRLGSHAQLSSKSRLLSFQQILIVKVPDVSDEVLLRSHSSQSNKASNFAANVAIKFPANLALNQGSVIGRHHMIPLFGR